MKTLLAGLQNDTSSSLADLDKTVIAGRVSQKTVDGVQVVSPPVTTFADVFTLTGVAPGFCVVNRETGRKFELQSGTTNAPTVLAFDFDSLTGTWTYIGKITMVLPLGVHAQRGFSFNDSDVNNIVLMVATTVTTSLGQGGVHYTQNVALTDFTPSGTVIYMATGNNQKAVYSARATGELGRLSQLTTVGGVDSGVNLNTLANQTKFWAQNGVGGAYQIYEFDHSLGTASLEGLVIDGVSSSTTPFAGTSPSAYFSMAAQNGYEIGVNSTASQESVILFNGVNPIPSNFVQTLNVQTIYYMRDLQLVGGVWYFNLATTSTGATVVPATTSTDFSMGRSNGISSSHFVKRTANLPAVTGTLLQSHSFGVTVPTEVVSNPALQGEDCIFLSTSSTLYLALISELTSLGTTWPSLTSSNLLGNGVDITTPANTYSRYSQILDHWIYVTNASKFVMKKHQNNTISRVFGSVINTYYEAQNPPAVPAGLTTVTSINIDDGWLFIVGGTTGQRGVISLDVRSDSLFDYSYVVSPVLSVEEGSILKYISTIEGMYDYTDVMNFYIKSSTNPNDPIFSTNTGWTAINTAADNSPTALGPYFRIKVTYNNATYGNNTPAQLSELIITYQSPNETSDFWEMSRDQSSNTSPSRTVFRLKKAYGTSVPTLYYRAYSLANALLINNNTSANAANFEYSTNNGVSWSSLGTIPNTVGTLVRYTFTTPPGVDIRVSLREE